MLQKMWLLRVPRANCAHLSSYPSIEIWRYLWIYQQTTMVNSYQDIKVLLAKFCWNLIFSEIHRGRLTAGTYKSPMKRKEHDLNQTSMIMLHVHLQGCTFWDILNQENILILKKQPKNWAAGHIRLYSNLMFSKARLLQSFIPPRSRWFTITHWTAHHFEQIPLVTYRLLVRSWYPNWSKLVTKSQPSWGIIK